jgi:hypothetical protein
MNRALCIIVLLLLSALLFARGKVEEERVPLNENWVLCVTTFDTSAMSEGQRIIGEIIVKHLVDSLNNLEYRLRVAAETGWYRDYAFYQSRSSAAKALLNKRTERDLLLFRGEPGWKYRQHVKKTDTEIADLEEAYRKSLDEEPLITEEPLFGFSESNMNGAFPLPPKPGGEYKFCKEQKADGFLSGEIKYFHGRIHVSLTLYTMYTDSFPWQDTIIFSLDDQDEALEEIEKSLLSAVLGGEPSHVTVNAKPDNAVITINGSFSGRGSVEDQERPPGTVNIHVTAENYETASLETKLLPGELTEIEADLKPLNLSTINFISPNNSNVSIYQGALFVGKAPLSLPLPVGGLQYFYAESPGGRETSPVVFPVNEVYSGDTRIQKNLQYQIDDILRLSNFDRGNMIFRTKRPPVSGQKRVDKARRLYYWSWAGTWAAMASAWLLYGLYNNTYYPAFQMNTTSVEMYEEASKAWMASVISIGVFSGAVLFEAFNIGRYVFIGGQDAPRVLRD